MSKRYTYYRIPNGNPYRGLDAKYAPVYVLAEIGKIATVNADSTVSWPGFSMPPLEMSLKASLVVLDPVGNELNETDSWRIIWQALVASIKSAPGKPVDPIELTTRVDKLAAEFFRQPLVKYVLISSLSIVDLPTKRIEVRGCEVSSLKTRGERFLLPRALTRPEDGSPFLKHINSSEYRLVMVTSVGRSKYEATDNALKSLSLLRGLWSLFATYGSWTIHGGSSPRRKPIGVIHTGPIHTLHLTNGALVDNDLYWYEPDFTEEQPIFQPSKGWEQIEKNRRWAMKRLSTLEYRQDLETLLIRYVDALDQSNPSIAFLKMWGILERVTDTIGGNYDETINRVVWTFHTESRPVTRNMLQSLRFRRNQYVHSGSSGGESDQVAYMIKYFVDPHLVRLISNPFKLKSIEEYGEFLSLPTDVATLEQRQRKLKQALRWLK